MGNFGNVLLRLRPTGTGGGPWRKSWQTARAVGGGRGHDCVGGKGHRMKIRVQAKSAADEYRHISVSPDGTKIQCDCDGFSGSMCSHIDAVLIAQEQAMVHPDDRKVAKTAIKAIAGRLDTPPEWKGSWRKNLRWRGLSSQGSITRRVRDETKPLVCFTGKLHKERAELIQEAEANGWETIDSPSPHTSVLVAADPTGSSSKLMNARKNGTPIITGEEWVMLMEDGVIPTAL